uniref:Uncharacterized protein LOC111118521 n=1 Tax=Crassostrea virginica TaxID=6565 RepID=A0A8B8CD98_CRAVI|nr:uncharacterized protein LOC111118521 [Crassostrea virginica]
MLGVTWEEGHASILFVCLGSCLSVVLLFIQWHRTTVNEHHKPNPSKTRNVPTIAQPVDRTSGRSKFTPSTFPEDQSFNKRGKPRRRKNNRSRQQLNQTLDRPTEFTDTTEARLKNFQALPVDDSSFQMVTKKKALCLELNFELEKEKPYIQAIFQDEPKTQEKHVKRALVYLQKYGVLPDIARVVLKAMDHIEELFAKTKREILSYQGYRIPKDYTEDEIKSIVYDLHEDMTPEEFVWVNQEFKAKHGYPPTPNEFSDLYEKCIKTGKMRELHTELRERYDEVRKEESKMQKEFGELQLKVARLEMLASRSFCKICHENEVAVLYLPCEHAVICTACYQRWMEGKSKKERVCQICRYPVKNSKNMILA